MPIGSTLNVLDGVVAFIDVKSSLGNPALAISSRLKYLGAEVVHTLMNSVTHVIFRNGSDLTRQWARKRGVRLVSPLWVKACHNHNTRLGEAAYACPEEDSLYSHDSVEVYQPSLAEQSNIVFPANQPVKRVRTSLKILPLGVPKQVEQFFQRIEQRKQREPTHLDLFSSTDYSGDEENLKVNVNPHRSSSVKVTHPRDSRRSKGKSFYQDEKPGDASEQLPVVSTQNNSLPSEVLSELQNKCSPIRSHDEVTTTGTVTVPETPLLKSPVFENNVHTVRQLTPLHPSCPISKLLTPVARCNSPLTARFKAGCNTHTLPAVRKRLSPGTPLTPQALIEWISTKQKPILKPKVKSPVPSVIRKTTPKRKRRKKVVRVAAHMPSTSCRRRANKRKLESSHKGEQTQGTDANEKIEADDQCSPKRRGSRTSDNADGIKNGTSRISVNSRKKNTTNNGQVLRKLRISIPVDMDASSGLSTLKTMASPESHIRTRSIRSPVQASCNIRPLTNRNSLEDFELRRLRRMCNITDSLQVSEQTVSHPDQSHLVIAFTGLRKDDEILLCTLARSSPLSNYELLSSRAPDATHDLVDSIDIKQCTHLVTVTPVRRTVNLLRGLLSGVRIVSMDWLRNSAQQGCWLDELTYQPLGLPRSSRVHLLPKLFRNVGPIYVGPSDNPPRRDLLDLLTLGGASTINRKAKAKITVGQWMPGPTCVKPTWVFDSIIQTRLLPLKPYLLQS